MTAEDRRRVAAWCPGQTGWPRVPQVKTEILGRVGSSPEIYTTIDRSAGVGQVIAFSAAPLRYRHIITGVGSRAVLALLRNAFTTPVTLSSFPLSFPCPMRHERYSGPVRRKRSVDPVVDKLAE